MQSNVATALTWTEEVNATVDATVATSLISVCLFCLLGLIASAAVLAVSSPETLAAVNAALM
jgi:hypothetical protein